MAPLAWKRLNRAKFYLDLAQHHADDREVFTAHFETYGVWARSVLDVLEKEVKRARVFGRFKNEFDRLWDDPLHLFFNEDRNIVIHEGKESTRKRAVYREFPVIHLYTKKDTPGGSAQYFFAKCDFKDQEVMGVCQQYVTRLEEAIRSAEKLGA